MHQMKGGACFSRNANSTDSRLRVVFKGTFFVGRSGTLKLLLKFVACKAPPRSFCANASLATTSLIVSWCTESLGVQTVANGAVAPKTPFAGKLDFFDAGDADRPQPQIDPCTAVRSLLKNPVAGIPKKLFPH